MILRIQDREREIVKYIYTQVYMYRHCIVLCMYLYNIGHEIINCSSRVQAKAWVECYI